MLAGGTEGLCVPRERILRGGPLVVSLRLKALLLLLSIVANDVCTMSSGRDGRGLLPLDFLLSAAPAARNFRPAVLVLLSEDDDCVCDSMWSVDVSAAKCWKIMCE